MFYEISIKFFIYVSKIHKINNYNDKKMELKWVDICYRDICFPSETKKPGK